jgi:hypothetical protein
MQVFLLSYLHFFRTLRKELVNKRGKAHMGKKMLCNLVSLPSVELAMIAR